MKIILKPYQSIKYNHKLTNRQINESTNQQKSVLLQTFIVNQPFMSTLLPPAPQAHLDTLLERYPSLQCCKDSLAQSYLLMEQSYLTQHKLLVAGNGGSAADSEHIVGELMKGFKLSRPVGSDFAQACKNIDKEMGTTIAEHLQGALPAIALTGHPGLSTAFMNDCVPELVFAQQMLGFGNSGDTFLAISTSGNSKNIIYAAIVAKAKGVKIVGLTGSKESKLSALADVCIQVPETETYKIQELHLPVYHCLCLMLEERFFG